MLDYSTSALCVSMVVLIKNKKKNKKMKYGVKC